MCNAHLFGWVFRVKRRDEKRREAHISALWERHESSQINSIRRRLALINEHADDDDDINDDDNNIVYQMASLVQETRHSPSTIRFHRVCSSRRDPTGPPLSRACCSSYLGCLFIHYNVQCKLSKLALGSKTNPSSSFDADDDDDTGDAADGARIWARAPHQPPEVANEDEQRTLTSRSDGIVWRGSTAPLS